MVKENPNKRARKENPEAKKRFKYKFIKCTKKPKYKKAKPK